MKKIVQRVGSMFCCCLLCLQYMIQPAHAIAIADDLVFATLASLAITSGITFKTIETFDPVVTAIKDKMVENGITEEAIRGYIRDGTRLVYDVGQYAWKTVVDVSDALWNGVKLAVDSLYNAGQNGVSVGGGGEFNIVIGNQTDLLPASSLMPIVYNRVDGAYFVLSMDGTTLISSYYGTNGVFSSSISYDSVQYIKLQVTSSKFRIIIKKYDLSENFAISDNLSSASFCRYGSAISVGTIYGSSAVDVPDYDWANEVTQTKVIEFPSTYKGDPDSNDENEKKLVYWPDIQKYLQGKDANDIASQNPNGLENPSAQPSPKPGDAVTDYPGPPAEGSESDTSLKGLLFTKFPFCIPWDIKNAFKLLVATPTPPSWEIDLVPTSVKQQVGIKADTTWRINMDGMEVVGTVARFCSTIGFCLALAVATRKIIHS